MLLYFKSYRANGPKQIGISKQNHILKSSELCIKTKPIGEIRINKL